MNSSIILLAIACVFGAIVLTPSERKPIESLHVISEIPDPFAFNDGTRVKSKKDWSRRRDEIKDAVLTYEYGQLPPKSPVKATEGLSKDLPSINATEREVELSTGPGGQIKVRLILTIPKAEDGHPAAVKGDLCWSR